MNCYLLENTNDYDVLLLLSFSLEYYVLYSCFFQDFYLRIFILFR